MADQPVTAARFAEATEQLYREMSNDHVPADAIARIVVYTEMLRLKLYGPRERNLIVKP